MAGSTTQDRVRRVSDLFVTGTELVLDDGSTGNDPVVLWVQRPNAYDKADIRRSAQTARDFRRIGLNETSPEILAVKTGLADYDNEALRNGVLGRYEGEIVSGAHADVQAQEDFQDTVKLLAGADAAKADGVTLSDEEEQALADANTAWFDRYQAALTVRREDKIAGLDGMSRDMLEEEYLDAYREIKGQEAFAEQHDAASIWKATRDCQATLDDNGRWQHLTCNHGRLFFATAADVRAMPDALLNAIRAKLTEDFGEVEAAKSDAPASSSASSEQVSDSAEPTASGQVA